MAKLPNSSLFLLIPNALILQDTNSLHCDFSAYFQITKNLTPTLMIVIKFGTGVDLTGSSKFPQPQLLPHLTYVLGCFDFKVADCFTLTLHLRPWVFVVKEDQIDLLFAFLRSLLRVCSMLLFLLLLSFHLFQESDDEVVPDTVCRFKNLADS